MRVFLYVWVHMVHGACRGQRVTSGATLRNAMHLLRKVSHWPELTSQTRLVGSPCLHLLTVEITVPTSVQHIFTEVPGIESRSTHASFPSHIHCHTASAYLFFHCVVLEIEPRACCLLTSSVSLSYTSISILISIYLF